MSMIALAERLRPGPRGLGHSLLLLIAVTAAIIVGLLAMHALNGHTETASAATVVMHEHGTVNPDVLDHGTAQPTTDGECADCGHVSMLAMGCALVLLIVALLILMPRVDIPWAAARRVLPGPIAHTSHLTRPPSLLVLCISRT